MTKVILSLAILMAGVVNAAHASTVTGLADWCVNLNGDIATACNGAGTGGSSGSSPGGINLAAFDQTAEPATNALGTVVVTLSAGENDQYSVFYADYDLDYSAYGSFDDSGATSGTLPADYSYELDDPNVSNIFNDFASDTLADTNNVGTPSGPPAQCCDVAFALAVSDLDVPVGGSGTVTYTVSSTAPASGFYIEQTNATDGDSIYLSAVVDITAPVGSPTPEPSTFVLVLGAIAGVLLLRRGKLVRN